MESGIQDEKLKERLEEINRRRQGDDGNELTWPEIYEFDLALLSVMPAKDLVRKAYDMRAKYRSISGSKDYDAYIASKPPDLTTLDLDSSASPPDAPVVTVESLRADVRYLLKQFYLYYSLLPYREGFRDELTRRARNTTFIILIVTGVLIGLGYGVQRTPRAVLAVVIFSGIIGGCMSMLQRIQSAPNEGDSLYNLAALASGWKGISLSPLYGAIFATLLFVLFSAGILKGSIFPVIITPCNYGDTAQAAGQRSETAALRNSLAITQAGQAESSGAQQPPAQTSAPAMTNESIVQNPCRPTPDTSFNGFLNGTYPENGISYALLVIWSFIAGFAERLVPDALNRLVTKNETIQGTTR